MILLYVRWYLRYPLSYRQLEEMMRERGLGVDHTTIYRWVQRYSPELDKRVRRHLKTVGNSWRVDETYIKIRGQWKYLYRAVDSLGNTIDFSRQVFGIDKRDIVGQVRFIDYVFGVVS